MPKETMGDYFEIASAKKEAEGGGDAEIEAALGGGESIPELAKATGVTDPVALVKLIKKVIETC